MRNTNKIRPNKPNKPGKKPPKPNPVTWPPLDLPDPPATSWNIGADENPN